MKKIILSLCLFLCSLFYTTAQVKTFTSAKQHFSINYPEKWVLLDIKFIPAITFGTISPKEDETDQFSENVNIVIDTTNVGSMDLTTYRDNSTKMLRLYLTSFSIVSKGIDTSNNKQKAATIIYKHTLGKLHLKVLVYLYMVNKKTYVISCSAEAGVFDKYQPTFIKICKSIAFR